jgi:toxin ParE1/3/4
MKILVTAKGRRDLSSILATSRVLFGLDAQRRYRALLQQALADLGADPERPGVNQPSGVSADILTYHSRLSVTRTPFGDRVGKPRHVVVFRVRRDLVEVVRILHDAMDVPRHLGSD